MATVTTVLWTAKKNAKGESPIYLRISDSSRTKYHSLRVRCKESQWNQRKGVVRSTRSNSDEINALIKQRLAAVDAEQLRLRRDGEPVTVERLKAFLSEAVSSQSSDYFQFADQVVSDHERRGKLYTAKRYKSVVAKLRRFAGEPLPFEAIDVKLLRQYKTHLIEHYNNKPNTVATNFNAIRTILYAAIREGKLPVERNPFRHFQVEHQSRVSRTKLSIDEIRAIEQLDLAAGSGIWHARNYFLFSFYCAGIRFKDIAELRLVNVRDGQLDYVMSKTDRRKRLTLPPPASRILGLYCTEADIAERPDRLLFPILDGYLLNSGVTRMNAIGSQNALTNKLLRRMAKLAGIDKHVSFHVSRHSFAVYAQRMSLDVYTVSKALGHSGLEITERYLKGFDQEAVDQGLSRLFPD